MSASTSTIRAHMNVGSTVGIVADTWGNADGAYSNAGIDIDNSGDIAGRSGISVATYGNATGYHSNAGIDIDNSGDHQPLGPL